MDMHDPYRAPVSLPINAAPPPLPARSVASDAAAYYAPPTWKIATLSIATLGLFPLYWFWRNWQAIKRESGGTQWPWARALFSPLWSFLCFSDLRDAASNRRRELGFAPGLLGALFFLLNLAGRVPNEAVAMVSLFTFVPLLPVNSLLRRYHREEKVDTRRMDRFGAWHTLVVAVGGGILLLALFGMALPNFR